MSRYFRRNKKTNTLIVVALVAAAALALTAMFSGVLRTANDENLLSLDFDTYKGDGYKIVANDDGSLTFEGEYKGETPDSVKYEELKLKTGEYTISTGTNGNPYTYCMTVTVPDDESTTKVVAYSDSGSAATFTLETETTVTVHIVVNEGADIDGLTIYPVLCKGDEAIKFYALNK